MLLGTNLELPIILQEIEHYCAFSREKDYLNNTAVSFDPLIIQRNNERAKEALSICVHYGPMPFYGIKDIESALLTAKKGGVLTAQDLISVAQLIHGVKGCVSFEKGIEEEHPFIHDLVSTLTIHSSVQEKIESCIDDYGEVKDEASPTLKSIRKELRNADGVINDAVNAFVSKHASSIVDSIVTYRNGRAVILVKASEKNSFGGLVYGDSQSGQASYIEPASLVNANNRKQELLSREKEEVERILLECSNEVGKIAEEEIANIETLGILDCIFAKAEWGKERNGVVASLTNEKEFYLKQARHPLIDPKAVIANTYQLKEPQHMLLITGPNTGGKTVSMKIIGLFVLMTYCGIPVTCEEAIIPYLDNVFVDIGDDQSVVESLSSFSAHIKKLAQVMKEATSKSLVLLDEIGSGTDPREGEALAISVLNELRERETLTVATTHYGRLKTYGKRHEDILVASVEFDMEHLVPTYHYLEGFTGQSNAFEVAERYGLPKGIISYARFLKNQAKSQEDELLEQLENQLLKNQKIEEELLLKQEELEEKTQALNKKEKQFQTQKEDLLYKAQEEANQYVREKIEEADEIIKEMREKEKSLKYHELLDLKKELKIEDEDELEVIDPSRYEYHVDDVVEILTSKQIARIIELRKKDIKVLLNGREIYVKKDQIRPSDRILPKEKPKSFVSVSSSSMFSSIPLECNLIGMHVDEALDTLKDYMDQARLKGLKTYRVIHGDGSGALRKAVHDLLAKNKEVESFRLGMPQEGGTGATIVKIKE